MKKLVALMAAILMVGGMFVGVALAATTIKLEVSNTVLIVGSEAYTISGSVKKLSGSLISAPLDIVLMNGATEVSSTVSINGKFTLDLYDHTPGFDPNGMYTVEFKNLPADYVLADDYEDPVVTYRYDVKLDSTPALRYGDTGKIITGKVVNSKAVGVAGVVVGFLGDSDTTRSNGTFVLDVNVNTAGTEYITVDGVDAKAVEIQGVAFKKLSAIESAVHTAFPVDLNLYAWGDEDKDNVVDPLEDLTDTAIYTLTGVKIKDWTGSNELTGSSLTSGYFTKLVIAGSDIPSEVYLGSKGILTISAVAGSESQYTGTITVNVADPANVNMLPNIGSASVNGGTFDVGVDVYTKDGGFPDSVKWEISGTGFTAAVKKGEVKAGSGQTAPLSFTVEDIVPNQGGTLTIKATAYDDHGAVIGTATSNITITGYSYTITPSSFTVGETKDVTVVVKNNKGEYVNNAAVTLTQGSTDFAVSSLTTNVNNGAYVLEDVKFPTVDPVTFEITDLSEDPTIMARATLTVSGQPVYDISLVTKKVTAGVESDVELKVTEDGDEIDGLGTGDIYVDGDTYDVTYDAEDSIYTVHDVVVTTTDKDVFVEVKTDSGTKVGKAQITVVMPTITFNPSPLTYLFKETVNVTITDPVTGDPIKADLELDGEELYATITGTGVKNHLDDEAVSGYELTTTAGSKSEYTFDLVVVPVDENKDVETSLTITEIDIYGGAVLTVEIPVRFGSATLNLDNKNLYIGANNKVTFTLTNARGEGLAERTIFQGSQDIGTTGENGTMMFNVQPAATGKITFKASTDAERDDKDQYVVAEAFANQDLRGPVINITVPEKTSESRVTISGTITDETRVQSVYVNNLPVAIVPGPSTIFVYELELRDGANPFNIIALDANGNGTPFIGTITRVAPEPPPAPKTVSVTIGKVDIAAGLDVAAYLEPGRTMVPLAFISRTLGGTAEWDAATNSVTIRLTGKVAVLTFGSKTAVVNGTAMTLYVAPTPKSGRTFVALADLAKLLGAQTSWNEATRTATVILP